MPDLSGALLLASRDGSTDPCDDDALYEAVVADARHVPIRWNGLYGSTREMTLKDVVRGPYPNVRINRAQFRYHLPANACAASRALLAQLKEPDIRKRSRVHLFQVRDDADSEYYLGAHVVVSGSHGHIVLHLLRDQSERDNIKREYRERPQHRLAESIVRSVVPPRHAVRSDLFDAVHGVRALPSNDRLYREKIVDSDVGDVLSADIARSVRITWRVVNMDTIQRSNEREFAIRDKCRVLRDVCMQRVVLVRIDATGTVTFRDFSDRLESEREHTTREGLARSLFTD
ncbi:hypothetical protein CYMTET_41739 [Cymbomonas tetramitiformis]|uniref:Uncharacterized protein n=1 Tax=Cymbomonas tetramitiformis TaxID=36881 RepID=A0AAE0BG92_9CHLO|nr:hypothetical protein CYMTET_53752 [Cymbomonas tetramitiformis]KAK3248829.1 hypothetical protein CYMTET_41739 [Cymbomonas tetramitiformis]